MNEDLPASAEVTTDGEVPAKTGELDNEPGIDAVPLAEQTWRQRNFSNNQAPSRWLSRLAIFVAILSLAAGWLGDIFFAQFVDNNPLLQIALNPRNRNLLATTNNIDAVSYYSVGFARLIFSDPFNYFIGFWFGERALSWIERRSKSYGPFVRDGERMFRRFSYPLVFAAPNNIICMLSGATGMRIRTFLFLNMSGTLTRLVIIRLLGEWLEEPIDAVLDFISRYRSPILILSAIAVAWTVFGEFRGDNSELNTLRDLDKDASDKAED